MLSTRTLVLGLASVAVAVAGVWWLQQQQQQHNKHLPDDKKAEKKRKQSPENTAKPSPVAEPVAAPVANAGAGAGAGGLSVADSSASDEIIDVNNTAAVAEVTLGKRVERVETPVPTTPPQSAPVADVEVTQHAEGATVDDGTVSANVTVRKKSQHEITSHDEDFPESSPIAYDPDRVCGETTVLDSVTTLESLETSAVLHDSMVTSLPEIMGDETQSDAGREEEEEDVHVITADDIDESTSAFDLSTSALDMSTSALEESKENIHTSIDAESRVDEIEQAETDAGPEQKAQKNKPKRKRNKNKASDSFANSSVDVNDSTNSSSAESHAPVRAAAASNKPKPSNQTNSGGKPLGKKRSYRSKK